MVLLVVCTFADAQAGQTTAATGTFSGGIVYGIRTYSTPYPVQSGAFSFEFRRQFDIRGGL